jgi:hypothetical protein
LPLRCWLLSSSKQSNPSATPVQGLWGLAALALILLLQAWGQAQGWAEKRRLESPSSVPLRAAQVLCLASEGPPHLSQHTRESTPVRTEPQCRRMSGLPTVRGDRTFGSGRLRMLLSGCFRRMAGNKRLGLR